VESEPAQESIDVESVLAEDFGQSPGRNTAGQLHLPQTILSVAEALAKEGVQWISGTDVWNAPAVANDLYRAAEARDAQLAV